MAITINGKNPIPPGPPGLSPYQVAAAGGYTGTEAEFNVALAGIDNKADKVIGATAGNLAGLDANGDLVDSSYCPIAGLMHPVANPEENVTVSKLPSQMNYFGAAGRLAFLGIVPGASYASGEISFETGPAFTPKNYMPLFDTGAEHNLNGRTPVFYISKYGIRAGYVWFNVFTCLAFIYRDNFQPGTKYDMYLDPMLPEHVVYIKDGYAVAPAKAFLSVPGVVNMVAVTDVASVPADLPNGSLVAVVEAAAATALAYDVIPVEEATV